MQWRSSQVFVHRKRELKMAPLELKIATHFTRIATNMQEYYRQGAATLVVAFVSLVMITAFMFTTGFYVMMDAMKDISLELIFVFEMAAGMPFMYVQIIFVQFCLSLVWLEMKVSKMNEVLDAVCREEIRSAPYELGQY